MATTIIQYDATSFDGDIVPVQVGDLAAYFDVLLGRTVLSFIDGANESAAYTKAVEMPTGYQGGALTARVGFIPGAGTLGDVDIEVQVEAFANGESLASPGFDAVNSAVVTPAGTNQLAIASVTLTNKASVVAGEQVRFLVRRDADDAADTFAGIVQLLWLAVQEA